MRSQTKCRGNLVYKIVYIEVIIGYYCRRQFRQCAIVLFYISYIEKSPECHFDTECYTKVI
jgi:hypothetical protein